MDTDLAQKPLYGFRISVGDPRQRPEYLQLTGSPVTDFVSDSGLRFIDDAQKLVFTDRLSGSERHLPAPGSSATCWLRTSTTQSNFMPGSHNQSITPC